MHPVVQHTDAQEHGTRHKAVRDHLYQAAGNAQIIEDEKAEGDKTHVRHRGVGHQLFHILLNQGHQTDIDHRHQ